MSYLAIPQEFGNALADRLLTATPLESGTFCRLYVVERGGVRRYILGGSIDSDEPWIHQEAELLTPSGKRISAAVSAAVSERCGLAFVHTHPTDPRPTRFSRIDIETTKRLGRTIAELLDGPFASLVISPGGWIGALADANGVTPFARLAVVGRSMRLGNAAGVPNDADLDDRQIRALGERTNELLRTLRVGVVGAGGLGSPVAETLARMGVGEIRLIDHDDLDTPSNARRIFGVGRAEIEMTPPPAKAEAVAAGINRLGLGTEIIPIVGDVMSESVQKHLLEVDVIINGTDTHSSRATVSELGIRGAIPLIDAGVRVGIRRSGKLDALWLERRIQIPEGPCLWCWGILDAEQVRVELMPEEQLRGLRREGYVTGAPAGPVPSVAALTVAAAGAVASGLLALLGDALDGAPLASGLDAITLESRPFQREDPDPTCVCSRWRRA